MTAMTVKVRGKMYDGSVWTKTVFCKGDFLDQVSFRPEDFAHLLPKEIEQRIEKFFSRFAVPASVGYAVLTKAGKAHAADIQSAFANLDTEAVPAVGKLHSLGDRLMPLIHMVQDLALPIGIVVASWGMIEMIMGNIEAGKHKMKWAIIGFIGMFLIPEVFFAIRDGFSGAGLGGV